MKTSFTNNHWLLWMNTEIFQEFIVGSGGNVDLVHGVKFNENVLGGFHIHHKWMSFPLNSEMRVLWRTDTERAIVCDLNCVALLYLLHVAAQFRVGRFVDSVPVHWYFDLLVQLEDHQGIVDVSAAQTNTSRCFAVVIWRMCSYSQHAACQRRTEEERWGVLRVEMVDTRVDSQWVHPVPEGALLSGFTWKQTNKQKKVCY